MRNKTTKIIRKTVYDQLAASELAYIKGIGSPTGQITMPSGKYTYATWLNTKMHCPQLEGQLDLLPEECYGATLSFEEAVADVRTERDYQIKKYKDQPQSLPGFLLILQQEIKEAVDGWMAGVNTGRDSPLHEVRQIAATAIACLERYGSTGITVNTNDVPLPYHNS